MVFPETNREAARLQRLLKKSEKQIPRRLKPGSSDKK
jgi:hypothetical protein